MIFVKYVSGYYLANILVSQIKFMHQGNLRPKAQGFSTIVPNWFTKRNRSHAATPLFIAAISNACNCKISKAMNFPKLYLENIQNEMSVVKYVDVWVESNKWHGFRIYPENDTFGCLDSLIITVNSPAKCCHVGY